MGNRIKTAFLLAGMTALLILIGRLVGGRTGMLVAFLLAAAINFFSYWYSDKIVLRMYGARRVDRHQAPELWSMVAELSQRAGLPMPKLYIIPEQAPNAFATGRNPDHAAVAVTEGLLRLMERREIMGVLAHELAHVKNHDILIGSIAATMAGAIMILANLARWSAIFGGMRDDEEGGGILGLIAMSIIAPIAAMIIQMAVSRSREYLADATGASFMGEGESLARALEKLGAYSGRLPLKTNPATSHLFIVAPLSGRSLASLFSTHPPLEERIARLRGRRSGPGRTEGVSAADQARNFWDSLSD